MKRDNKGNKVENKVKKKSRPGSKRKMKRDIALIIDFEATCWNHPTPAGMHNEIIEIGISGVDYRTKEVVLRDTIIVKPDFSTISSFCTELTTITQDYVDKNGISFAEACDILRKKYKSKDRIWFSWGEYDRKIIEANCQLKGIDNPFGRTHINMKPLFSFAFGITKDLGVSQALEQLGMDFDGTPHRGGDDAYNIAKILKKTFVPIMDSPIYNSLDARRDHQKMIEYLDKTYPEGLLDGNVTRVINKTTPTNEQHGTEQ